MVNPLPQVSEETCFPKQNRVGFAYNLGQNHAFWIFSWPNKHKVCGRGLWKYPDRQLGLIASPLQDKSVFSLFLLS